MNLLRLMTLAVVALAVAVAAGAPAEGAKKRSCLRGGGTLEAIDGPVRVVRVKVPKQSRFETRHERLYACWAKTGRRVRIADEVDNGLDNIARTRVEIVGDRYVGAIEHNEGGVSESRTARIYDARRGRLLHDSAECEKVDLGDFGGVVDVVFLDRGGMAMVCDQLLLFRNATAEVETLEPAGTDVRGLAVGRNSHWFGPRLFWTIATPDGEVTKSVQL